VEWSGRPVTGLALDLRSRVYQVDHVASNLISEQIEIATQSLRFTSAICVIAANFRTISQTVNCHSAISRFSKNQNGGRPRSAILDCCTRVATTHKA